MDIMWSDIVAFLLIRPTNGMLFFFSTCMKCEMLREDSCFLNQYYCSDKRWKTPQNMNHFIHICMYVSYIGNSWSNYNSMVRYMLPQSKPNLCWLFAKIWKMAEMRVCVCACGWKNGSIFCYLFKHMCKHGVRKLLPIAIQFNIQQRIWWHRKSCLSAFRFHIHNTSMQSSLISSHPIKILIAQYWLLRTHDAFSMPDARCR